MKAVIIIALINALVFSKQSNNRWTQDQLSNVTVLLYQQISDTSSSIGTGTVISQNSRYFLITATHVAIKLKKSSKIVFRLNGDKPKVYDFVSFFKSQKFSWEHHPIADLSMIELFPTNNITIQLFQKCSFPISQIYTGKQLPSRDADLTFFGYPIIDLEMEHFSPLVFTGQLASGLITQRRYDTGTKCNFYYLNVPSIQGCSGSGVYLAVQKAIVIGGKVTYYIGIVHGTQGDNTGGKLAAITPSYYITDLLKKY